MSAYLGFFYIAIRASMIVAVHCITFLLPLYYGALETLLL